MIHLIKTLVLLLTLASAKNEFRRQLKGGRGGGGRSSYSSSRGSSYTKSARYYKSKGNQYKATGGVYVYSTTKNTPSRSNNYWDGSKTYKELYIYYLPSNYYNPVGYYSPTYTLVYYDGYGYNFYYNTYGYYDYSEHPT